ncbi:hypothetical protein GGS26DRAFT_422688 [Hypomontagnella submonticulosa]|nr:hypothetical protein GGS26DRAFT_422688 [Hypomontagnella submonticulosa]
MFYVLMDSTCALLFSLYFTVLCVVIDDVRSVRGSVRAEGWRIPLRTLEVNLTVPFALFSFFSPCSLHRRIAYARIDPLGLLCKKFHRFLYLLCLPRTWHVCVAEGVDKKRREEVRYEKRLFQPPSHHVPSFDDHEYLTIITKKKKSTMNIAILPFF